jgi:hypothetical protein
MKTINLGTIASNFTQQDQRYKWCQEQIGKGAYFDSRAFWDPEVKWSVDQSYGNIYFTFRNDRDATMFVLRWS